MKMDKVFGWHAATILTETASTPERIVKMVEQNGVSKRQGRNAR
jgi:hypothetical protein